MTFSKRNQNILTFIALFFANIGLTICALYNAYLFGSTFISADAGIALPLYILLAGAMLPNFLINYLVGVPTFVFALGACFVSWIGILAGIGFLLCFATAYWANPKVMNEVFADKVNTAVQ